MLTVIFHRKTNTSNVVQDMFRILDGEEKIIFQKYVDAQGEVNQLTAVKNIVYGYKLGLLMTAEAFLTSGDLISGEEE